jgi:hypothetical protein
MKDFKGQKTHTIKLVKPLTVFQYSAVEILDSVVGFRYLNSETYQENWKPSVFNIRRLVELGLERDSTPVKSIKSNFLTFNIPSCVTEPKLIVDSYYLC